MPMRLAVTLALLAFCLPFTACRKSGEGETLSPGGIGGECPVESCGPAMGMPNRQCGDGTTGGPTGRGLRNPDGTCGWEVRSCPEDAAPPADTAAQP